MAEFALVIPILIILILTSVQLVPAITGRSSVLDAAATVVERANRYLAPSRETRATQLAILCDQALEIARLRIKASGYGVTNRDDGCRSGGPDANHNPSVNVAVLHDNRSARGRRTLEVTDSANPPELRICIGYQYQLMYGRGIFWFIDQAWSNAFTYQYCGNSILYGFRTR